MKDIDGYTTFVVNDAGNVRGVDWEFNAWGGELGGLYDSWEQDNLVARKVLEIERVDRYNAPIVLEGGAIHVDGEGTLITTSACLLNPNRNGDMPREQMETHLRDYLGVSHIIWLAFEAFEETDGHVDGICAFVRLGVLAVDWTDDPESPEYDVCRSVWDQLSAATDAKGRRFELHKLSAASPAPITAAEAAGIASVPGSYPRHAGDPIGGTYVNFYIANGGVIVPTYDDPNDENALRILADLFPAREVVGVPAREIAIGGGMVHCITQQQPRRRS
ncbi:MAG: agmatine deiminase family protein [Chloroflexota bacterium]